MIPSKLHHRLPIRFLTHNWSWYGPNSDSLGGCRFSTTARLVKIPKKLRPLDRKILSNLDSSSWPGGAFSVSRPFVILLHPSEQKHPRMPLVFIDKLR